MNQTSVRDALPPPVSKKPVLGVSPSLASRPPPLNSGPNFLPPSNQQPTLPSIEDEGKLPHSHDKVLKLSHSLHGSNRETHNYPTTTTPPSTTTSLHKSFHSTSILSSLAEPVSSSDRPGKAEIS